MPSADCRPALRATLGAGAEVVAALGAETNPTAAPPQYDPPCNNCGKEGSEEPVRNDDLEPTARGKDRVAVAKAKKVQTFAPHIPQQIRRLHGRPRRPSKPDFIAS